MRRTAFTTALLAVVLVGGAACSDDSSDDGASATTPVGVETTVAGAPTDTGAGVVPCDGVPAKADLEAIVGVTLNEGDASLGVGVCNFYGVDDPANLVALLPNTDPSAIASFQALGPDSGVVPVDDAALPGAVSQFGSVLYVEGDTLYTVSVLLVGVDPTAATVLAVDVMKLWVG